jgi:hypothetical protein
MRSYYAQNSGNFELSRIALQKSYLSNTVSLLEWFNPNPSPTGLSRRFDATSQPFWDLCTQSGLNVSQTSPYTYTR